METLIKYHKVNKNTEKRKKKRSKELEVLRLFKAKGEAWRRDQKAMRKALSEKGEMRQAEVGPPSYQSQYPLVEAPPPSYKGQFPVIEGKVEFRGEVTQKDEGSREQKGTASCLDGYREVSALLRQAVQEGLRGSEIMTEDQACGSEKKGSEIKVGYGASGSNAEGLMHLLDTPNPPCRGWSQLQEKEAETESEAGGEEDNVDHRIVRSRRSVRPPTRYTPMLPLMVKGAQTQYVPWAGQDLEGLILRLPILAEGAGKWIKAFEEETMGRLLAIGDIKAVLARVLGVDGMERLLRSSGLAAATGTPVNDACHFDGYRANLWHQLRLTFPPRLSVVEMKVEPIKEGESPAAYLQAQEKRWRTETEQDLQNPAFRGLYRRALQDALPKPVKSRLRQVVGLVTMPEEQYREQLIHAIDLYREEEDSAKERERELAKKLNQMQLEELTAKKKKVQAPVVSPDPSPRGQPVNSRQSPVAGFPQDTKWPPVPDWNKEGRYDRWGADQRAPIYP